MRLLRIGAVVLCLFSVVLVPAQAVAVNVALNKTVTGSGALSGTLSNIVNGVFLPEGTIWNSSSTVSWNGLTPYMTIDLGGTFTINSLIVQADNNDTYQVSYFNPGTQTWAVAWSVPAPMTYAGIETRGAVNGVAGQTDPYVLSTPITASMLQVSATSGDNMYAVSQVQAFGTVLPEPSATLLLVSTGLGAMLVRRNRKTA